MNFTALLHPDPLKVSQLFRFKNNNVLEFTHKDFSTQLASKLIESIILGLPIGSFLISTNGANGGFVVLDGNKRLSIIEDFMMDKFKLEGMEIRKDLNGLSHDFIPQFDKNKIEDYTLRTAKIGAASVDYYDFIVKQLNQKL